jgi:hypothetical protein
MSYLDFMDHAGSNYDITGDLLVYTVQSKKKTVEIRFEQHSHEIRRIKGRGRRVISSALIAKMKGRRIWFGSHMIGNIVLKTKMEKMLKGKEKENQKSQIRQK